MMNKLFLSFLLFLLITLGAGPQLLAQPANDACGSAIDITGSFGSNVCGDDAGATNQDGDLTSCWDPNSEIWYTFQASSTELIDFSVTSWCGTTYEPNITLYSGACGGLSEVSCVDYTGDGTMTAQVTEGDWYYVAIDNDGCSGSVCFDVTDSPPPVAGCGSGPSNDLIGNAEYVNECGTSFTTNNIGAGDCISEYLTENDCGGNIGNFDCNNSTDNGGTSTTGKDACYGSSDNDIWYTFCPSEAGSWDLTIDIYNCTCGNGYQYSIYQGSEAEFVQYNDCVAGCGGSSGCTGTRSTTLNLDPANGCVFINFDGYAKNNCTNSVGSNGDECYVDVSVTCTDCPSGCALILPVELTYFSALPRHNDVLLSWQTASEINNDYFVIQRANNSLYEDIGKLSAIGGNSSSVIEYNFVDKNPKAGMNYYRLKQVDIDGEYYYSKVVSYEYNSEENFEITNIKTTAYGIEIKYYVPDNEAANIQIYNSVGQKLHDQAVASKEGYNSIQVDLPDLNYGIHFIIIEQAEHVITKKFLNTTN